MSQKESQDKLFKLNDERKKILGPENRQWVKKTAYCVAYSASIQNPLSEDDVEKINMLYEETFLK